MSLENGPKSYSNEAIKAQLDEDKNRLAASKDAQLAELKERSRRGLTKEYVEDPGVASIDREETLTRMRIGEVLSAQESADRKNYEKQTGKPAGFLNRLLGMKGTDVLISDELYERALKEDKEFNEERKKFNRERDEKQAEAKFLEWQKRQREQGR